MGARPVASRLRASALPAVLDTAAADPLAAKRPQVCALMVFVCMSNQKAGLYGPNLETCERCNLSNVCMTQRGEPRGQGCGYTAFSQFQCAQAARPPTQRAAACLPGATHQAPLVAPSSTASSAPAGRAPCSVPWRAQSAPPAGRRFLCAVGVLWWLGSSILLSLYLLGRSPPPMTARNCYRDAPRRCRPLGADAQRALLGLCGQRGAARPISGRR